MHVFTLKATSTFAIQQTSLDLEAEIQKTSIDNGASYPSFITPIFEGKFICMTKIS